MSVAYDNFVADVPGKVDAMQTALETSFNSFFSGMTEAEKKQAQTKVLEYKAVTPRQIHARKTVLRLIQSY